VWGKEARQISDPELTLPERARLRELERENRELKAENEFLGKATAFFAKKHP
jgi:transposase